MVAPALVQAYEAARDKVKTYVRWIGEAARLQGRGGRARDAQERNKVDPEVLKRKEEERKAKAEGKRTARRLVASRPCVARTTWGRAVADQVLSSNAAAPGSEEETGEALAQRLGGVRPKRKDPP